MALPLHRFDTGKVPLGLVIEHNIIASKVLCVCVCVCLQGEYGLYEAVQEIKMKKDELAVRDK